MAETPKPVTPQNAQQLPEHEKDLQERIDSFNKKILPLLAEHELGLAALPKILGNGTIGADPVIVSVRPAPKPNELAKVE